MKSPALILILAAGFGTSPDIAPDPLSGGVNLKPGAETTDIAMLEEEVRMTLFPKMTRVEADFLMHNTGERTELEIGFPCDYPGELHDFKASCDGTALEEKEVQKNWLDDRQRPMTTHWMLWTQTFEKEEKKKITVTYWTEGEIFHWIDSERGVNSMLYVEPELNKVKSRRSNYILDTGAGWKGAIGKAVVIATFVGFTRDHVRRFSPENGVLTERELRWTFENLEPAYENNIRITFNPRLTRSQEAAVFKRWLKKRPDRDLNLHVADLYFKAGRAEDALRVYDALIPSAFKTDADGTLLYWDDVSSTLEAAGKFLGASADQSSTDFKRRIEKVIPLLEVLLSEQTLRTDALDRKSPIFDSEEERLEAVTLLQRCRVELGKHRK